MLLLPEDEDATSRRRDLVSLPVLSKGFWRWGDDLERDYIE